MSANPLKRSDDAQRRIDVVTAGHHNDDAFVAQHLTDSAANVRTAALGAMHRMGTLTAAHLAAALNDPEHTVRRRAAELSGEYPATELATALHDEHPDVVETAAWACGEHEQVDDNTLQRLIDLVTDHDTPLVREAAAAALGAIGDERGLPAILTACTDKPHVRRRAVLALAPFDGPEVDAAIERALSDRDWQVRQSAEDLTGQ